MSHLSVATRLLLVSGLALAIAPTSATAADKKPTPLKSTNHPDLVVQSIAITKLECVSGKPYVTAKATVKNVSTKHAADLSPSPFHIVLLLGIGGGSQPMCPGEISHPMGGPTQIAPGATFEGSSTLCIPPGGYYITAKADPSNVVKEIDEGNNYKALPLSVPNPCK
jgi:hypothetical protein